jgi:hypothetical protein
LTPALIGAASVAGRRWGQGVGGAIVGLPLTSGPVAFFLALEQGAPFARAAATGALAGTIAEAAFCLAYGWMAVRARGALALPAGCAAFGVVAALLQRLAPAAPASFVAAVAALVVARWLMPHGSSPRARTPAPRWDVPVRMVVTTALVLLLTGAAPALGPRLAGLLATFPLYAAVLTVFAHRLDGAAPAVEVLRGLLLGLAGFAGFFLVLASLVERVGVTTAFTAATVVALAAQACALGLVLRGK